MFRHSGPGRHGRPQPGELWPAHRRNSHDKPECAVSQSRKTPWHTHVRQTPLRPSRRSRVWSLSSRCAAKARSVIGQRITFAGGLPISLHGSTGFLFSGSAEKRSGCPRPDRYSGFGRGPKPGLSAVELIHPRRQRPTADLPGRPEGHVRDHEEELRKLPLLQATSP